MRQWKFGNGSKKKVRGLKRKYEEIRNWILEETESVPNPNDYGLGYWHIHLPWAQDYINSKKTPNKFRKAIMQLLINRVNHLNEMKTAEQSDYKIYTLISLPNLYDSQIVVLPNKSWLEGFFERNSEEQLWKPLKSERNLIEEWNLSLPSGLDIRGYNEFFQKMMERLLKMKFGL